jgi:transcription antitermination factor NusG
MNSSLMFSKWGRILAKKLMKPIQRKKPDIDQRKWNIVKGDTVKVIQGPQAGQQGKVLKVLRWQCRVIVEGVNLVNLNFIIVLPQMKCFVVFFF